MNINIKELLNITFINLCYNEVKNDVMNILYSNFNMNPIDNL